MNAHLPRALSRRAAPRPRTAAEAAAAARLLGTDHPLARALGKSRTANEQLLTLTIVDAAAVGLISGGAPIGGPLLAVSVLLQWGIALSLMLTRQEINDESRALVITGGAPRTLACVERERRRLIDPRTRAHLARSLEDLVQLARTAAGAARPDTEPFRHRLLLLRLEPELREIVGLLREDTADAVGVAMVERLLTEAGSPLYGLRDDRLREELARIRSQLALS